MPLSSSDVERVVAEIGAYHAHHTDAFDWRVYALVHLEDMPCECYEVVYPDGFSLIFFRSEDGRLHPAHKMTYVVRSS